RRLVRMAVEDIGLADPQALVVANAAKEAYDFLGTPEGELALAQAVIYLATAPKSNAAYVAFKAASRVAKEAGSLMPPMTILNAPTRFMKNEGYGAGYTYDHDEPDAFSGQDYWPEKLGRQHFYEPVERGFEREIRKRLEWWEKLRAERRRGVWPPKELSTEQGGTTPGTAALGASDEYHESRLRRLRPSLRPIRTKRPGAGARGPASGSGHGQGAGHSEGRGQGACARHARARASEGGGARQGVPGRAGAGIFGQGGHQGSRQGGGDRDARHRRADPDGRAG